MLGSPGGPVWLSATSVHSPSFVLWDYVPAAVVAIVLLAFAVTLIVVAAHQRRDIE